MVPSSVMTINGDGCLMTSIFIKVLMEIGRATVSIKL